MSYVVNTALSLFKSHCIVGQIAWFFILNLPFCWPGNVAFHIKAYSIVEQESVFFVLNLTLLLVRKQRFQFNPLPFYLPGGGGPHIQPHGFVYQCVLNFRSNVTALFMKRGWFPC